MGTLSDVISEELQLPAKNAYLLPIRFKFNTADAPTIFTGAAQIIESVAHTATGVWTITVKERFRHWKGTLGKSCSLELDVPTDSAVYFGALDPVAGTIVVNVFTAGVAADIAPGSNDGNFCELLLALKYGTAVDGTGI